MHSRHIISLDAIDNADDWLLLGDPHATDPLHVLIQAELQQDAELAGFDTVDDYLHAHPEITLN